MISPDPTAGLLFDEATHSYTYDGVPMTSVTQLIGQYKKPFDSGYWSEVKAQQRGVPTSTILAEWDAKRNQATATGDRVHQEAETIAWGLDQGGGRVYTPKWEIEQESGKAKALGRWFADHIEMAGGFLLPEFKVVHPEYRVAGTVDLIAGNYQGRPAILDYKQNEVIALTGKYNNLLSPFQRGKLALPDLPIWHYALQMSAYNRILRDCYGFHAELQMLVHLKAEGEYKELELPYLDAHIEKIFSLR